LRRLLRITEGTDCASRATCDSVIFLRSVSASLEEAPVFARTPPGKSLRYGQPERGMFERFPVETLDAAARHAMGDTPVAESVWLDAYDGYYYDARGADPLPVLRIRYADPQET
jgi:hypothetical protein